MNLPLSFSSLEGLLCLTSGEENRTLYIFDNAVFRVLSLTNG